MEDKILYILSEVCEDDIVFNERDVDLNEAGLLDSLGRVQFIVDVEEEFGIRIEATEIDWNKVNTANKIVKFVSEIIEGTRNETI